MRCLSRSSLILLALLLAAHANEPEATPAASHAPEDEILMREFPVIPGVRSKLGPDGRSGGYHVRSQDSALDRIVAEERALRTVFEEFGVTWPEGSQVQYRAVLGLLRVWNTETNLQKIDDTLVRLLLTPFQFQIEATYLTIGKDVADKLSMAGELSVSNVQKSWRDGNAEIIANPRVVTQNGHEATMKLVKEITFPVRFIYRDPDDAHGTRTNAVTTAMVPTAFETREVGALLRILPAISSQNGLIHLNVTPHYVDLTAWNEHTTTTQTKDQLIKTTCKRPIFESYGAKTSLFCKDGATILASSDVGYPDENHYLVVLVRTTLVGSDGRPLRKQKTDKLAQ